MKITKKKIEDVAEELGWHVDWQTQRRKVYNKGKWDKEITEKYVEFSQESPAGEDFSVCVFYDALHNIAHELYTWWEDFDIEEHVKMWLEAKSNGVLGVPDIVTLVKDAQDIDGMCEKLWLAVEAI